VPSAIILWRGDHGVIESFWSSTIPGATEQSVLTNGDRVVQLGDEILRIRLKRTIDVDAEARWDDPGVDKKITN
jgi:hypothetical protein